jgi:hypothetical protein
MPQVLSQMTLVVDNGSDELPLYVDGAAIRIYAAALTPLQIGTSFAGGTDPAFLAK